MWRPMSMVDKLNMWQKKPFDSITFYFNQIISFEIKQEERKNYGESRSPGWVNPIGWMPLSILKYGKHFPLIHSNHLEIRNCCLILSSRENPPLTDNEMRLHLNKQS